MRELSQMETKKLENIIKSYAYTCKYGTSKRCMQLAYEAKEYGISLEELNKRAKELHKNDNFKEGKIMKDTREKYRKEYKNFIKTEEGKRWQNLWKMETGSDRIGGDYGDYLYDFHPELLQ